MIESGHMIALAIVLPIFDCLFVAVRFLVKKKKARTYTADDYLILLSLIVLIGLACMSIYGAADQGIGKEAYKQTSDGGLNTDQDERLVVTKHIAKSAALITPFVLGTAKLSVLFFYRVIFRGTTFNILSISVIVLVCCWMIFSFFLDLFQCGARIPVMWTSAKNVAEICLPGLAIGLSVAAVDVFTDICILLLPIYWIVKLHLPAWKKAWIGGIFLFGTITLAVSAVRLAELSLVYPGHNSNPNQFLYLTTIVFYLTLEAGLSIIAACLPTLGPLFTSTGRLKLRSRTSRSRSTSSGRLVPFSWSWFRQSGGRVSRTHDTDVPDIQLVPQNKRNAPKVFIAGNSPPDSLTGVENFSDNIKVTTDIYHEVLSIRN